MSKRTKKKVKFKPKLNRITVIAMIIPLLLVAGFIGFNLVGEAKSLVGMGPNAVEEKQSNEFYSLRSNATDYQHTLYEELSKEVNKSDLEDLAIAELVVENFVADFYTWTNKKGSYDVGGLEYIYGGQYMNFQNYARDSFYYYLSYYIEEHGVANLIEVSEVNAKAAYTDPVEYNDKSFQAYYVEASWTYKSGSALDTSNYQTRAYFKVIRNEFNRFEITEMNFY